MTIYNSAWAQHYAPHLSKTEINQLQGSKCGENSLLLTQIIQPQAFSPQTRTYIPVAWHKRVNGKSHFVAASLCDGTADVGWEHQCLFANAMRIASPGDADFSSPSSRLVVAPYHILTIEFDKRDLGFFQQQLGWLRSSGNKSDSAVGKFVSHLRRRHADVAGLSVVYSGHKSLHFHFVVTTHGLTGAVPEPTSIRLGFQRAWDRLRDEFHNFAPFNLPIGVKADESLRQPENFRRLPGGFRINEEEDHLFGVPAGEVLFQPVLWEQLKLERRGKGTDALLDLADFTLPPVIPQRASSPKSGRSGEMSDDDRSASERLAAIFDGKARHPRFAYLDRSAAEPVAYFYNHPDDQHPTSVMRSNFKTVLLQGSNPLGLTNDEAGSAGMAMHHLPLPLAEMLSVWSDERHRELMGPGGRVRTPVEAEFAAKAVDQQTATSAMADILLGSLRNNLRQPETHLLCAPEGISKTRTLMAAAPTLISDLETANLPTWMMFALPTYEAALAKAAEFAALQGDGTGELTPVVIESFDKIYRDLCPTKKSVITHEQAARSGYQSRWAMIRTEQKPVASLVEEHYRRLRETLSSKAPVIFTVHQVAQEWATGMPSRLWLAGTPSEVEEDRLAARKATRLGILVHDEIGPDAIADCMLSNRMKRARQLIRGMGWTSRTSLPERWRTFQDSGARHEFSFDELRAVAETSEASWQQVVAGESFEYGRCHKTYGDIYASAHNCRWHVRARKWADDAAHKTLILTTEFVPLILAEHIGDWRTTCLDTPLLPKDRLLTRPSRKLTSRTVGRHVLEAQEEAAAKGRRLMAVGNKLGHLSDADTHHGAKGSNAYIGEDVVQSLTMMPPEQYAKFQALNAWTGRNDLARIAHIDQFNQTAGRNLGFRKRTGASQHCLINRRLFESLTTVLSYARYDMIDDCVEASQKIRRRRATKSKHLARQPQQGLVRLRAALKR